jgi:hypothetical protein
MKYCQGTRCHEYKTKDRIRGSKGDKHYETRKRSQFYYLGGNACSMQCERDWFNTFGALALRHFGMIHEPKRTSASRAWYKTYCWRGNGNDLHYFVNDLLGERIAITEEQYDDQNITQPNNLSQ